MEGNRESGESPERSRHCNQGVLFDRNPLISIWGRTKSASIWKPGDLPSSHTRIPSRKGAVNTRQYDCMNGLLFCARKSRLRVDGIFFVWWK